MVDDNLFRLMEEESTETLYDLYQKHFIERGEKAGDPYL